MIEEVFFLLEEASCKAFLEQLIPRLQVNWKPTFIVFEGKSDLEKNIPIKLKGINKPNSKFFIIEDQDLNDCIKLKDKLKAKCVDAGKPDTIIRIVCKELESWYLGDLETIEKLFQINNFNKKFSNNKKYKTPDNIANPKAELKRITNQRYSEIISSRELGKTINIDANTSHSFNILIETIRNLSNNNN